MKTDKQAATYAALRSQPLWKLLASTNAPFALAILQANLYDGDQRLPASILHERVAKDLETLKTTGVELAQSPQEYVAEWLVNGYLERRFLAGEPEEQYELSTAAAAAIRFVDSLNQPYTAATGSRLTLVINALVQLAEDTDTDKAHRIQRLVQERARIDKEIEAVERGEAKVLPAATAYERAREIIALADNLVGDFRRVRDQFDHLNRELRQKILEDAPSRGNVLEALFAGIDLIAESPAGRSFTAFWRLLTDPRQSSALDQALDDVLLREFAKELDVKDRRFLIGLTRTLLTQGGAVHDVFQNFARSLKHFVASREYLEQRRLNQVIKEAQRAALAVKDEINPAQPLTYWLELTSSRVRSASQWALYDPAMQAIPGGMSEGQAAGIDLDAIGELVARSEIDFRSLKQDILSLVEERGQASIADVLERCPAKQGLGSVVGLLTLGSRHGIRTTDQVETVSWTGEDHVERRAKIPKFYFSQERAHELA
jgi:hypothetical protein